MLALPTDSHLEHASQGMDVEMDAGEFLLRAEAS